MVTTKKFSRVAAMLLALVMILTLVPFQSFAAEVPVENLTLKDGVTVAISSDMTEDQIKKALFDALVENPEGANYQDYSWEVYGSAKSSPAWNTESRWIDFIEGGSWTSKHGLITYNYTVKAVKDSGDADYKVRLAGGTQEVTITKVSSSTVNYSYDLAKGSVLVDGNQVNGTVTGVSPATELQFTVVPKEGYKVASVTVNGEAVEAVDGVYTVLPVATTDIDVTFVEDGTFYNVTVNAGEGVTVKMDGIEVSGDVKVAEGVEYTFEYIPDDSTSVKAVKLGEEDVTSDVSFANYVGTQKLTFTDNAALTVESIAKNAELVLTETREAGIVINADGSWNYDGIRANIIDALIDKAQSVGVEFTQDNVEIFYRSGYDTVWGGGDGFYEALDDTDHSLAWHEDFSALAKSEAVNLRIFFKGNDQFRATDYVYVDVTFNDVQNSVIVIKENPSVTIAETSNGVFDYTDLEQKVFDAAIDAENSLPSGLTLEDIELTVPKVTATGDYDVTAKYPGSTSYYASEVTFKVHFDVTLLPTANIALKADTVDAVLKETSVGVYDNAALKEAVYAAAVDLDACATNGLDVSKLVFELQDVTADGQYTATVSYPETEDHHANSVTVTVNVTIDKLPTVQFEQVKDSATLERMYNASSEEYDYDKLKEQIFNDVLSITGVDGLTWDMLDYQYKVYEKLGGNIGTYQQLDVDTVAGDFTGSMYNYLRNGGSFDLKVTVPGTDKYYGGSFEFKLNVSVINPYVSEIVTNEGTHEVTLNKTKDGGYDYEALKQEIFAAAVSEVKNVPDSFELKWDAFDYEYKIYGTLSEDFYAFDEQNGPAGAKKFLRDGGEFTVRIFLDDGEGFYGSFADVTINVTVKDPFASELVLNSEIAPVTLKETSVGVYDYNALKADIFAAAIDAANSTPANVALSDCEVVLPEISGSNTYNVTVKFLGSFDYNASSVSFDIQINVQDLPTANIALNTTSVNAVLKETENGVYDLDALKKAVFDQAVNSAESTPAGLSYADVTVTFDREVNADGQYTATIKYAGTNQMHGASAEVKVNVTVDKIPTVVINTQQRSVVLNKTLDGGYDYDGLKEAIFNECMRIEGVEGLTWNNFTYQYKVYEKAGGLIGTYQAFELDKIAGDPDGTWYKYLRDGGNFEIKVSIPDSSSYYGAEAEFTVDVTIGDPYDAEIALKNNYQKDYVLNYGADGQFDYDRLEKEIFDAVIDVENSTASVSFETATITYQILDAMGSPVGIGAGSYYDFAQGTLPADSGNTYKYLYKGGTFNIKVAVPATESHRAVEVVFSVNVEPYSRVSSSVVLNGGSMNYTNDLNAIKAYVYSLIDMNASKLPADVSIDDFSFEYYARNYTAGDLPGVEYRWVPFEGMEHPTLAGSYFKQIGNGTNKIRVTFNGTDDYLASTSNEVEFTMSKASFSISLKQNYKYLDEDLPVDFVQPSVNDNFEHFYFILDASSAQATIYLDSLSGIAQTDISVLPSTMFQAVLGRSAIEVYVEGLSRDELIKLINSDELASYCENYNINVAAINAMKDIVNSIPTSVTNIKLKEGQPTKPGTYTVFAMAANENYETAFASSVFYVKYHSTGTKLVFVQDTDGLNSFNVGDFDYSAVVTKDGVPVQSNNVRYIYTGFRSNALFYASTKEGPRQAGIYTQTAWTLGGTYAFPKTRTFVVSLL